MASGETRTLTLGRVEAGGVERTFCLNAGVGIDAETTAWVEARPQLKRRLKQGAFVIGATRAGLRRGPARCPCGPTTAPRCRPPP